MGNLLGFFHPTYNRVNPMSTLHFQRLQQASVPTTGEAGDEFDESSHRGWVAVGFFGFVIIVVWNK